MRGNNGPEFFKPKKISAEAIEAMKPVNDNGVETPSETCLRMANFLIDLRELDPGTYDPDVINLQKRAFANYDRKALMEYIATSTEASWDQHAARYHAVMQLLIEELQTLLANGESLTPEAHDAMNLYLADTEKRGQ